MSISGGSNSLLWDLSVHIWRFQQLFIGPQCPNMAVPTAYYWTSTSISGGSNSLLLDLNVHIGRFQQLIIGPQGVPSVDLKLISPYFGCLHLYFGCLNLSLYFGCLNVYFWCLTSCFGCLNLYFGCLIPYPVWGRPQKNAFFVAPVRAVLGSSTGHGLMSLLFSDGPREGAET